MDIVWSLAICVFCAMLLGGRHSRLLKAAVLVFALLLMICCKVQGTI